MHQSKVAKFKARWPFLNGGSIIKMADEVDLKENGGEGRGEVSFTVTLMFRQVLLKLVNILCEDVTGQVLKICSVKSKYLLKILSRVVKHVS